MKIYELKKVVFSGPGETLELVGLFQTKEDAEKRASELGISDPYFHVIEEVVVQ